jgi:hypothetical protein
MRRTKVASDFVPLFLSIFFLTSTAVTLVQAQVAPAAGTSVPVKMLDAADSGSDPAGSQYRASVTKAVSAANGVVIAQGAAATVTLMSSGSGYTAQLSSITINGQQVAVTSNSATVSAVAQLVRSNAASAMGSMLGGLGHRVSAPATVAATATGQHISLPTGTTLTFVLGASPAGPAPVAAQPLTASAEAAPSSTSSSTAAFASGAEGPLSAMEICFSNPPPNPSDLNYRTQYLTAVFEVPVDTLRAVPALEPAFSAYLKETYQYPSAGITCQPIWSVGDAQTAQKKIASGRDTAKLKIVDTGWRYGQPPLTHGQSGFDPLVLGPGGLDLMQHRLTTYYCTLDAAGGTSMVPPQPYNPQIATRYISPVFQADWAAAPVSMAYDVYIRDHFVHDLDLSDLSPRCNAQSPAMQAMTHQSALVGSKLIRDIVPVDFTDTPAQAAAATAAAAPSAATPRPTAASTGGPFISCSTSGGAGIDTYLTGVFQTTRPVRHLPSGGNLVDQSVLDDFYAYLKQKGYNFKPGSNYGCDVSPTEAAAKAAQHKRAYEGGACSTCGKIVETGWKE